VRPAVATSFQNGGDALFTDPPQCYLHHQASFFGGILQGNKPELQPIDDIAFFPFPDLNPAYPGLRQISGEVVGMFNDTPQARAFLRYLATPEASTLLAESGIWTTPNKSVSPDAYPSALSRQAAQVLTGAAGVHYDASALMPQQMNDAFLKAILSYVQEPDQLDAILASLDQVQQEAYP
jgi:alpha-glucoside transport system substrate-binding protein